MRQRPYHVWGQVPHIGLALSRNIHTTLTGEIMNLTGNTIFITGGGSGIGRGLAEALHKRGNQVIIAGRRKGHLTEVASTNPGMRWVELDIEQPASISAVAGKLIAEYPKLNVLINNAGVMNIDDVSTSIDEKLLVTTLTTNG